MKIYQKTFIDKMILEAVNEKYAMLLYGTEEFFELFIDHNIPLIFNF